MLEMFYTILFIGAPLFVLIIYVLTRKGTQNSFTQENIPLSDEEVYKTIPPQFLQHLGVYAYRRAFLLRLAALEPAALEQLEKLEQLRALALGRVIQVGIVGHSSPGVDTYEDYQEFVRIYRNGFSSCAA